jgi:hypothetical protein
MVVICFALLPDNIAALFASQGFASAEALWCNSRQLPLRRLA